MPILSKLQAKPNSENQHVHLLHYREFQSGLYGHPERDAESGIHFTSGRLGHLWGYVNGVALAHPGQKIILLGSDGAQQEGNDAEAARFAVAHGLEVKLFVDDNDVTISGHPAEYMAGFSVAKTLAGQGLKVMEGDGEELDSLFLRIRNALAAAGPVAVVNKRTMAPGIQGLEGLPKAHDVISLETAVEYLTARGHTAAAEILKVTKKHQPSQTRYLGTLVHEDRSVMSSPRDEFGKAVCAMIEKMSVEERKGRVLVVDNDLEGSCGLHNIRRQFPSLFIPGGIMERHNFSAAAGFGSEPGRQGIYGTFAAFIEMLISEITMARLNNANVLAHFSHSGPDWMADNTTHYGVNNFFADNGLLEGNTTRLYFPADSNQMRALVQRVFADPGLRFVFSSRSPVPYLLNREGEEMFNPEKGYVFIPGKDELIQEGKIQEGMIQEGKIQEGMIQEGMIQEGKAGYVVSYGDMLHRSLHAVRKLTQQGMNIGLINKPTLNVVDEEMMNQVRDAPFILVVESQNQRTGLGVRYGTWLLERGFKGQYGYVGAVRPGKGGLFEQIPYQDLAPDDLQDKIRSLYNESHKV